MTITVTLAATDARPRRWRAITRPLDQAALDALYTRLVMALMADPAADLDGLVTAALRETREEPTP